MRIVLVAVLLVLLAAVRADGQHASAALDSLGDNAARQTQRFADRRVAVADGYRRLGTDFPGMGEHWLHPRALINGAIDAARPTLLTYATINGKPTLLGVGFVIVTRGDSQPVGIPGWPDAWHEHSGFFADESGAGPGRPSGDTHVWVLHAWTNLRNPGGRFTPDNWALPFARLGVAIPDSVDADVARALSFAVGGDTYLRNVLTDAGLATSGNRTTIDSTIERARIRARTIASRIPVNETLPLRDALDLRAAWTELGASLRALLGSPVEQFLAVPHATHPPLHHQDQAAPTPNRARARDTDTASASTSDSSL